MSRGVVISKRQKTASGGTFGARRSLVVFKRQNTGGGEINRVNCVFECKPCSQSRVACRL